MSCAGTPAANEPAEARSRAASTRTGRFISSPFHLRRDAVERPVRGGCGSSGKLRRSHAADQPIGPGMHEAAVAREPAFDTQRSAADVRVTRLPAVAVRRAGETGRALLRRGASDASTLEV